MSADDPDHQQHRAPPRPRTRASLIRSYKWDTLTPAERDAVTDALGVAATRASVGIGTVLTLTAVITGARRGKPPLPWYTRTLAVPFFSLVASYIGILSGGPLYAQRILSVPESRLAEDLRTVIGDWQARVPVPVELESVDQNQSPQNLGPPPKTLPVGEAEVPALERRMRPKRQDHSERKSVAYWLGLTKS